MPNISRPFKILALDIRPRSIQAVLTTKRGRHLTIERAVSVTTVTTSPNDVGRALVENLGARGVHTITSLDAKSVATDSHAVPAYIEARDYEGVAARKAAKINRPTRQSRRVRWRAGDDNRLVISIADEKAVETAAETLRAWGCQPWIIADPSIVWLDTLALCGIVDDFETTTLFAAPDGEGAIHNDIIAYDPDNTRFVTAATQIIRNKALDTPLERLTYFGPAARFALLRSSLRGLNIELQPAIPPNLNQTQPWTFALALAQYGASQ